MQKIMTPIIWLVLGAWLAVAGCGGGYYYPTPGYVPYEQPYTSDVPPYFYNNDPNLTQWYTAPYWNPNIGP